MSQILAKVQQAEQLLRDGKAPEALAIAQRLLPKGPGDPGLNSLMASILLRMGRYEQAEYYAGRALQAEPASAPLMVALATVLHARQKPADALALLRRAVETDPDDPGACLALANALMDGHDSPAAAALLERALARRADPQLSVSYAGALLTMGKIEETVAFTREAIRLYPDEPMLVAGLPVALTYQYGADPAEIASTHRAYAALLRRQRPPGLRFEHTAPRDPERRLRVGVVSPDLRQHSVSFFVEPFFERHDRSRIELIAYSTTRSPDRVTNRLRPHASLWRDCPNLTDIELARLMHADRLDIALDLAGHTLGNNLPAFALRPAPVQATYCGYPDTTGLSEIDYRIVDSLTDPPTPEVDAHAAERLCRLDPCFLCYRPLEGAPAPSRDAAFPGPVFGSFNASRKINRGLIALWTRLLTRVPGSTLILKSFDFASRGAADRIREEFVRLGVDAARLAFLAATPTLADHLALYARMDVALDAFPYHGTTTTCEALWMGVPVVTLAGRTHAGRVGVSLLTNAGAPELIAHSEDAYVDLASSLVADAPRLASYRSTLREKLRGSPVCDAAAFAARFDGALRAMWRGYCAGA
ncbi:MAG: tetratricopeptide repeat protein [Planctomycetota bacterium]|nr:tetratricopeptide repeat protein [Planctomycetota bacterium]